MASYLFYPEDASEYVKMNSYKHIPIPLRFYELELQYTLKNTQLNYGVTYSSGDPANRLYSKIKEYAILEKSIFTSIEYIYFILNIGYYSRRNNSNEIIELNFNICESKKYSNKLCDLFGMFICKIHNASKHIGLAYEISAIYAIQNAYSILENFEQAPNIRKLSDVNEQSFIDFMNFHTNSKYLHFFYQALEPWVNDIVLVPRERMLVKNRLEQFNQGNSRGLTRERRYSTLEEIRNGTPDEI